MKQFFKDIFYVTIQQIVFVSIIVIVFLWYHAIFKYDMKLNAAQKVIQNNFSFDIVDSYITLQPWSASYCWFHVEIWESITLKEDVELQNKIEAALEAAEIFKDIHWVHIHGNSVHIFTSDDCDYYEWRNKSTKFNYNKYHIDI